MVRTRVGTRVLRTYVRTCTLMSQLIVHSIGSHTIAMRAMHTPVSERSSSLTTTGTILFAGDMAADAHEYGATHVDAATMPRLAHTRTAVAKPQC
jgi:uncharacterized membrane protein YgdD (TMEM256/DUF423 family)